MYKLAEKGLATTQQVTGEPACHMISRPDSAPHAAIVHAPPQMRRKGIHKIGMVGIRQIMDPQNNMGHAQNA